jgi:hypothetical protein
LCTSSSKKAVARRQELVDERRLIVDVLRSEREGQVLEADGDLRDPADRLDALAAERDRFVGLRVRQRGPVGEAPRRHPAVMLAEVHVPPRAHVALEPREPRALPLLELRAQERKLDAVRVEPAGFFVRREQRIGPVGNSVRAPAEVEAPLERADDALFEERQRRFAEVLGGREHQADADRSHGLILAELAVCALRSAALGSRRRRDALARAHGARPARVRRVAWTLRCGAQPKEVSNEAHSCLAHGTGRGRLHRRSGRRLDLDRAR